MHKHEWQSTHIPNGSKVKKARKTSPGAICSGCKLVARETSKKSAESWVKRLPK